MQKYCLPFVLSLCLSIFGSTKDVVSEKELEPSVLEFYGYLQEAIKENSWWSTIDYAEIISTHFPQSPLAQESTFFIGNAYYNLGQYELANEYFTSYLNLSVAPKRFEETIYLKFDIAEKFRNGAKKPLFKSSKLPKIVSGEEDALEIYDEVITVLPHNEITAKALLGKADMQFKQKEYKSSLDTLDLLIRRFPKHDLAAQGFVQKSRTYVSQCKTKNSDPLLLDLAEVNLRKFKNAFPREDRIAEVEKNFNEMHEIFAENLMETGRFFQKTKKIPASIIYYSKVLSQYPNTKAANEAQEKLNLLAPTHG